MKTLILCAAVICATATGAFADAHASSGYGGTVDAAGNPALSEITRNEILKIVPNADLTNLTPDDIRDLENFFNNSENLRAGNNPRGRLKKILDQH